MRWNHPHEDALAVNNRQCTHHRESAMPRCSSGISRECYATCAARREEKNGGPISMETDEAVDRLAKVIEYFRSIEDPRSIWDQDGHGQQLRIWDHAEQEREIEAIAKALASQNPMLSEEETARILIYEAVVPHVHQAFGASDSNAKDVAEAVIVERARFERFTEIELPVLFLALKAPIEVAGVTFEPLDIDHFKESSMGKWTYGIYDGRLMAKGRLRSPGDGSKYLTNALEFIDSALRLLCGVVFPWQVRAARRSCYSRQRPAAGRDALQDAQPVRNDRLDGVSRLAASAGRVNESASENRGAVGRRCGRSRRVRQFRTNDRHRETAPDRVPLAW